jgi:abortive infection bacteriophage resistance protein
MKEYKSANDLIEKLKIKGLKIEDPQKGKKILSEVNYFYLKGYFKPFTYECDLSKLNKFIAGVSLNNIIALYSFDKNIKSLLFRSILDIEQKIKNIMCDVISSRYGINDCVYLDRSNFDLSSPFVDTNLSKLKSQISENGSKHSAYQYYKNKHGYFPFWILSKILSFGSIFNLFSIMKPSDQDHIAMTALTRVDFTSHVRKFKSLFSLLVAIRNICAHDDILYNINLTYTHITPMPIHDKLELSEYGHKIGHTDLLAVIVSLKYLLPQNQFNELVTNIDSEINHLIEKIDNWNRSDALKTLNLPSDFLLIKD